MEIHYVLGHAGLNARIGETDTDLRCFSLEVRSRLVDGNETGDGKEWSVKGVLYQDDTVRSLKKTRKKTSAEPVVVDLVSM